MKNQEPNKSEKKKRNLRPLFSRLPIALCALTICLLLILWDMGKIQIPFLKKIDRREPLRTETETTEAIGFDENKTDLSPENIDWALYAKQTIESLYDRSFLDNPADLIPEGGLDPKNGSVVKTNLPNKEYKLLAGFLTAPDGSIYRGRDLALLPDGDAYFVTAYRSEDGSILFMHREGGDYYTFDENSFSFLPASFDPVTQSKAISLPMPASYGQEDEYVKRTLSNGLFGYEGTYQNGSRRKKFSVENLYPTAFAYSEGYAVMADENGFLTIRNEKGEAILTDRTFILPEKNGLDALGFHYFDTGLLRVTEVLYEEDGSIKEEKELVINPLGQEFLFPKGYTPTSYYNGIFTVTNGTLFGHYSAMGEWITSPVYTEAHPFFYGVAVVRNEAGKMGLVNLKGKEILPCTFDYIEDFSQGMGLILDKAAGSYLLTIVTGNYMGSVGEITPPQKTQYTKITITRGPLNTYQEEEAPETLELTEPITKEEKPLLPEFWE